MIKITNKQTNKQNWCKNLNPLCIWNHLWVWRNQCCHLAVSFHQWPLREDCSAFYVMSCIDSSASEDGIVSGDCFLSLCSFMEISICKLGGAVYYVYCLVYCVLWACVCVALCSTKINQFVMRMNLSKFLVHLVHLGLYRFVLVQIWARACYLLSLKYAFIWLLACERLSIGKSSFC